MVSIPNRPSVIGWECKDYADGWIFFGTLAAALEYQYESGCIMRPVYAESHVIELVNDRDPYGFLIVTQKDVGRRVRVSVQSSVEFIYGTITSPGGMSAYVQLDDSYYSKTISKLYLEYLKDEEML